MGQHRVVSLLPSATEVVAAAAGSEVLVGRSHECDFPLAIDNLPALTSANNDFVSSAQMNDAVTSSLQAGNSLYRLDDQLLASLRPDCVVTQDLCAVCAVDLSTVQRAVSDSVQILCLNPFTLEDVLADIRRVGTALHTESRAETSARKLEHRIDVACKLAAARSAGVRPKVDPLFPGGHWTPQIVELAGGVHPINPPRGPKLGAKASFPLDHATFIESDCDWIVICPCGLDLRQTAKELPALTSQPWWPGLRAVQKGQVAVCDGHQMFNRPGPRLVDGLEWLVGLLWDCPETIPRGFPWMMLEELQQLYPDAAAVVPGVAVSAADSDPCSLTPDIEAAHAAAQSAGSNTYLDPVTGYTVFTEGFLRDKQGFCCGNRCRHCPFGHFMVEPMRGKRTARFKGATHLRPGKHTVKGPVTCIIWHGGPASHLLLRAAQARHQNTPEQTQQTWAPVLVVAVDGQDQVWGRRGIKIEKLRYKRPEIHFQKMEIRKGST
ncbi:hypothetical protein WJX73_002587 [Symbiochloris irregularis]|uniref:Fe/B12 periplasmic-binding domain-containing protein n=1 Tax=Symbiochloris irregularis TaxID=706552 RepID=A0AAW1PDG7_9CHLO